MKSSGETKIFIILGLIALLGGGALAGLNFLQNKDNAAAPTAQPTPRTFELTADKFDALLKDAKHIEGDATAPVTMVEFADIECPSCRRAYNNVLKDLLKTKKKDFRLSFRHFPLDMHPNAIPAAIAAEAAGKQGKFWEMYAALFDGEKTELNEDLIQKQAKAIGLDMAKFEKDRKDPALKAAIDADKQKATEYQIDMTPTFFIRNNDGKIYQAVGADQFRDTLKKIGFIQ